MNITDKKLLFKMRQTNLLPNMKELAGQVKTPRTWLTTSYTDSTDGTVHEVLVIEFDDGSVYRTETRAFIDAFMAYDEAFSEEAEKPAIKITTSASKRGNPYIKFVLD